MPSRPTPKRAGLSPQAAEGYENLARLRERAGDFEGAQHWYKQALARGAGTGTIVRFALSCPIFCADQASIDAHRARIEGNVAALEGQPLELVDGPETVGAATFYLPYQGVNDVDLATRIDRLLTRIWQPSPLPTRASTERRPRVAFVSAHFRAHTVGRFYAPLLEMLPRDEFELAVLSVGQHDDALAARIARAANDYRAVPCTHAAARAALYDMDADIVVYPDVGMEPVTSWLASERLAPVQCAGWGHPVTTGRAAIDHFISSAWVEPPEAEAHYSENLVALTAWPAVHEDPGVPSPRPARTTFDFAADDRIYLCPQSLFKFHPDFDAYLRAILDRDSDGRIVLLESRPAWRAQLERRFAHTLGACAERVCFLPYLDSDRFKALLVAADVVLDTLHFGGGYTSFETLWSEVPFVTERGRYMRGRVTAGFADLVVAEDALVEGAEAYAERAVELATPGARRANFIDTLRRNKQRLVDMGPSVVAGYMNFFRGELETVERRRLET